MIRKSLFLSLFIALLLSCSEKKDIKVACIGDSITEGAGIYRQSKSSYPVQLDSILGAGYNVLNCGRSGANMLKKSDLPYWICNEFYNVFAFEPDVIVIKLGTNDSKPQNWDEAGYARDFQSMIDTLRTIATKPEIYVCLPVPAYNGSWGIRDSVIKEGVIPAIHKISLENKLKVIDLYTPLSNHAEFFPDGIHPDEAGALAIAGIVSNTIKLH